jgi:hypothetical protein
VKKFLVLICILTLAASVSATICVRGTDSSGGQLIYDDQQDITWYDFNPGSMAYLDAQTWVDELSVTFNNQVFSDWRLPHLDSTYGYYNNSPLQAEMGRLFYNDLGLTSGFDYTTEQLNDNVFENLKSYHYWTDRLYMSQNRYVFSFHNYTGYMVGGTTGQVGTFDYRYGSLTMAVMDGDVASGDIVCGNRVNLLDFAVFSHNWLTNSSDAAFDKNSDLNNDGTIDFNDLIILCEHWLIGNYEIVEELE